MKFKFTSNSKAQAEKFQKYIKADRNLDSTLTEKDGKFLVEYTTPDMEMSEAKWKANKKAKKAKSNDMKKSECSTANVTSADVCCDGPEYVEYCDMMECMNEFARYFYNEMQYQLNWVWSEIDWLANRLYKHETNGHLPPINGAEKMQKALDALGIGGDYEIQKPIVYASTRLGKSMEVDFSVTK